MKKKLKLNNRWLAAFLAVLCLIGVCAVLWKSSDTNIPQNEVSSDDPIPDSPSKPEQTDPSPEEQDEPNEQTASGLSFPYQLDDGNIVVSSVFPTSMDNMDADLEYGDDIATIEFENKSGKDLLKASFDVVTTNDEIIHFEITDLPANSTDWAMSPEGTTIKLQSEVKSIKGSFEYGDLPMMEDQIEITIENETSVHVRNISDQTIENLVIGYKCFMDEVYFGGATFQETISKLNPGEEYVFEADSCYLGSARVVSIQKEPGI